MNPTSPIRDHATVTPDAPAFQHADGRTVSYAELDCTVDALAHRLRALPLAPGQVAMILTGNLFRYLAAFLALARLGVTSAPNTFPPELVAISLVDAGQPSMGCARDVAFVEFWPADLLAAGTPAPIAHHEAANTVVAYCPSSGTTSKSPKFVEFTQDLLERRATALSLPGSRRQACLMPPVGGLGLTMTLRALWGGGVVLEPNLNAAEFASWLLEARVEYMIISPIGLYKILQLLPEPRPSYSLQGVEFGGAVLPLKTYELACRRLCDNIFGRYGASEIGATAGASMAELIAVPNAVGRPFPGVEVEIVDADDQPVPRGEAGAIRVRSPHIARRYFRNEEASARSFKHGWAYPGDVGILEPDGMLRVFGRVDDVVNQGGVKVNPQQVEEMLMRLADLREAAVFGVTVDGRTLLCAAIVPNGPLQADAFHAICRERLGKLAPAFIMTMRELPRNAMGKVLRRELAEAAVRSSQQAAGRPAAK